MDTILISFAIASFFLALAPGPDNFFVLTFSAKYGKTLGFYTVLGLVSGCFIHTTFVAFGVAALITSNSFLVSILKYIGAIYLLFVAIKVYNSDSFPFFYVPKGDSESISLEENIKVYFHKNIGACWATKTPCVGGSGDLNYLKVKKILGFNVFLDKNNLK